MLAINGLWFRAVLLAGWAHFVRALGWVYGAPSPLPVVLRARHRAVEAAILHARYVRDLIRMRLGAMRSADTSLSETIYLANVYDLAERRLANLREREAQITGDLAPTPTGST